MHHPDESARDAAELSRLGYAQELFRTMGGFSNFAISFSIISILTGAMTLYDYGLSMGGPAEMAFGWPLVFAFTLMVTLSMAELAAAYPTSGAMYHWSAILGGRTWGWTTAWLSIVGLVSTLAAIDYGCAQSLAPLLGLASSPGNLLCLFAVILLLHALINHYGVRLVAWLNDASAVVHIAGVFIIVGLLFWRAEKQPIAFFVQTHSSQPFPYWHAFVLGLLQAQWTFTGYEASAHVSEETHDPRRRVPWGMVMSVVVSGVVGYVLLFALTLCIKDIGGVLSARDVDGNPVPAVYTILRQSLGVAWGTLTPAIIGAAQWFCGLSAVTSLSRVIYAFARDDGMPMSSLWRRVSATHRTPGPAIWLSVIAAFVPIIGTLWISDTYAAVASVSTIGLYLAYTAPIFLRFRSRNSPIFTAAREWNLGRHATWINVLAIGWTGFMAVVLALPTDPNKDKLSLAGYAMAAVSLWLGFYWMMVERKRYRGPQGVLMTQ